MSDRVSERSLIRAFFNFDEIIERPRWMSFAQLIQLGVILAGFIWASVREREDRPDVTGYNLLEGLLAACILLVATSIIIFIAQLIYKAIVRLARNRRRAHLEKVTKAKLKSDYRRALKALLAASGLKPGQLSTVDRAEPCQFEQSLFSDAELDAFLGPLRDQTFRAVTPHGTQVKFAGSGKHHLSGQNFFDGYYGPFRVTCVFFTPDAFIIGECICDPFTGDLQKRIRTVLRSSIQTADFRTHLRTVPISQPILDDWLDNRRLDQEEHHRIRTILAKHKNTQATARRYGQNLPALPFA
ncbi:MAG: hypothetical protein CMK07_02885, partial [Ponticaulis sp.]|nr:hypothetical protein [Ponticaulis sp.]